jgi:hypothetical protein
VGSLGVLESLVQQRHDEVRTVMMLVEVKTNRRIMSDVGLAFGIFENAYELTKSPTRKKPELCGWGLGVVNYLAGA